MQKNFFSGLSVHVIERHAIRRVFLFAVLLGSVGTFVGTLVGEPIIAIGVPTLVMLGYVFWTYKAEVDVPDVIIGDSYYYLGFILTLVSLTASLVSLGDVDVSISKIIGSFGAAMITTIIGLISRLVTTTFSMEASERRERLARDIEKEIDRFLAQVRTMSDKVAGDMVSMSTNVSEAMKKTHETFEKSGNQLETVTGGISIKLEKSIDKLVSQIDQIKVDPHLVETSVQKSLQDFAAGVANITASYNVATDKVVAANNILVSKYNNFEEGMFSHQEKLISAFRSKTDSEFELMTKAIHSIGSSISDHQKSLETIIIEAREMANSTTDSYVAQINGQKVIIEKINSHIKDVEIVASSAAKIMNKHHKVLEEEALLFAEKASSIEALQALNESLAKSLTQNSENITAIDNMLIVTNNKITDSLNNLNQATTTVRESSALASGDLREMYKKLTVAVDVLNKNEH